MESSPAFEAPATAGRVQRVGVQRVEAEATLRAMLEEALRGVDAGRIDIELMVKPHKAAGGGQ